MNKLETAAAEAILGEIKGACEDKAIHADCIKSLAEAYKTLCEGALINATISDDSKTAPTGN